MEKLDKFRGCLIGGAVGDALGYPVEFRSIYSIRRHYGKEGIKEFVLNKNGIALFSDDTQMTLFTAEGLLLCEQDEEKRGTRKGYKEYIYKGYQCWLETQDKTEKIPEDYKSTLLNIPQLQYLRAPGGTCLSALRSGKDSTYDNPINDSKGCGGVMRVAPIGLFLNEKKYSLEEIDMIGSDAALLTHGHELGYIPAAAMVHIVNLAVNYSEMTIKEIIEDAIEMMKKLFKNAIHLNEFVDIMKLALNLAENATDDVEAIYQIGGGWVAEEALAIAVYCAVKYATDFEKAIVVSVNHSGDSDSTGAITGNILGAYLGLEAIPEKFLTNLELREEILTIADKLYKV